MLANPCSLINLDINDPFVSCREIPPMKLKITIPGKFQPSSVGVSSCVFLGPESYKRWTLPEH